MTSISAIKPKPRHSTKTLADQLKERVRSALRRQLGKPPGPVEIDLGITPAALERYFEGLAQAKRIGYGARWHLVPRYPFSYFDLTNPQQLAIASHYTNFDVALVPTGKATLEPYDARFEWTQG
jgi:hypothetical protein